MSKYFLFIFLVCQLALYSCSGQDKKVVWKETVGELDPNGYHQGAIYYLVDTQVYSSVFTHKNDRAVKGERYTMRYNINNPIEVEIDYWHPIFESGEKTLPAKAVIVKINGNTNSFHPKPVVRYKIKGEKLVRWIYLPEHYRRLYQNLKEGQYYKVDRWERDLNRVVLRLDKPMDSM